MNYTFNISDNTFYHFEVVIWGQVQKLAYVINNIREIRLSDGKIL